MLFDVTLGIMLGVAGYELIRQWWMDVFRAD
jgi:hypothetical protein